jgi:endoglucanase
VRARMWSAALLAMVVCAAVGTVREHPAAAAARASAVLPALTLSAPGGPALVVQGTGWQANEKVDFYLDTEWGTTWLGQAVASSGVVPATSLSLPAWLQTDSGQTSNCFVATLDASGNPGFGQGCHYNLVAMQRGSKDMASAGFNLSITGGTWTIDFPGGQATVSGRVDGGCRGEVASPRSEPPLTPDLPLHITGSTTHPGRWIVDAAGRRFKLASVNWYGAEEADYVPAGLQCQSAAAIAQQIRDAGFTAVRLPWSNAMEELDPSVCTQQNPDPASPFGAGEECIPPEALAANGGLLQKKDALSIYESVIGALASDGIVVVLDNHSTDAAWSPSSYDGLWWGGLIWDDQYGLGQSWQNRTVQWDEDWDSLVGYLSAGPYSRYIVGADLRNEPSLIPTYAYNPDHSPGPCGAFAPQCAASWTAASPPSPPGTGCLSQPGSGQIATNWLTAAEEAGNTVRCADPNLLVMVEGTGFGDDLSVVGHGGTAQQCTDATTQVCLLPDGSTHPDVVYSPHAYPPSGASTQSYDKFKTDLGDSWGYILAQGRSYTAPVWVGEFGASATAIPPFSPVTGGSPCDTTKTDNGPWLNCFINYLASNDTDWSYWALNGSHADEGIARGADPNLGGHSGAAAEPTALYTPEPYGLLDPGWARPSSTNLSLDLQRVEIPSQGPGSWTPRTAPLPAGAAPAGLNGVSCPAIGSCAAVGYNNPSGSQQGLIETLASHTWTPAEAPVPANASSSPETYLNSVTCPAAGSCLATGDYVDAANGVQPLIETLASGTWTPTELPQPGSASATPNASLFAVTCPAAGSCTAAGYYTDSGGNLQPLIETLSGGTWTAAKAPLPANAASDPFAFLTSASCPAAGSGIVVGHYNDGNGNPGVIETLSGGKWTAAQAPQPANGAAAATNGLYSVTCPATGSCTAVGEYGDTSGNDQGLIEMLSGGTWTPAQAPLPANAGNQPLGSLNSVTCPAAGSCTAAGGYVDSNGSQQGLIETLSGGTWTTAETALAANSVAYPYSYLSGVACPGAGSCTAVGTYVDPIGDEGLIDTHNPPALVR